MVDKNQIFNDCSHAVDLLMKLTREACTNTLSDNVRFIKCYEVEEEIAAEQETFISVHLVFLDHEVSPEYHIGILTVLHNLGKEKYDLNESVVSFERKRRDILNRMIIRPQDNHPLP